MFSLAEYKAMLATPTFQRRIFVHEDFMVQKKRKAIMAEMPDYAQFLKQEQKNFQKYTNSKMRNKFFSYAPLLNSQQEYHLFRKYNFCKFRFKEILESKMHDNFKLHYASRYLNLSLEIRKQLAESNFRLSTQLFKRFRAKEALDRDMVLSDACLDLIRCVDYFDYRRGIKFSTYATWVIKSNCSRNLEDKQKRDKKVQYSDCTFLIEGVSEADEVQKRNNDIDFLVNKCLGFLSLDLKTKELKIIESYYGLNGQNQKNLSELGVEFGVTKERIRQLKERGLQIMREMAHRVNLQDSLPD